MPKGYPTSYGYKGYVRDRWMVFATQQEYLEYIREEKDGTD